MKSYIIKPPRYAQAKYVLHEVTANPDYPKPKAFVNITIGNVQALLDLIDKSEPFYLEVHP